jgi:hypothetical protein
VHAVARPEDSDSLVALLVREFGLRQTDPYDLLYIEDNQSTNEVVRLSALERWLIEADLLLAVRHQGR